MRLMLIFLVLAGVCRCLAGGGGDWQKWLSPELRSTEEKRAAVEGKLKELGEPMIGETTSEIGYQASRWRWLPPQPHWVQIDLQKAVRIDAIALFPAILQWRSRQPVPFAFPLRFRVDVSNDAKFQTFIPIIESVQDVSLSEATPVVVDVPGVEARFVRLTVTKPPKEAGRYFFALSEIMVLSGNLNVAIRCPVRAASSAEAPPRWSMKNLVDGRTPFHPPIRYQPAPHDGIFAGPAGGVARPWIQLDLGKPFTLDQIVLHPVHSRLGGEVPGFLFPKHLRIETSLDPDFTNRTVLFDAGDYQNPGNNPMTFKAQKVEARHVRITAVQSSGDTARFGLSEIQIYAHGRNIAAHSVITRTPDIKSHWSYVWPVTDLVDGFTSYGRLMELPEWLQTWKLRTRLQAELRSLEAHELALRSEAQGRAGFIGGTVVAAVVLAAGILIVRNRQRRNQELEDLRMRLARDIHDDIGSNLAGLVVLSEVATDSDPQNSAQREDWREVNRIARETLDAMREVLWLVGGRERTDLDLMKHMQLAASRMLAGKEVRWKTTLDRFPAEWPGDAKRDLFLFFKEALSNIVRHSRATQVELSVAIHDHRLALSIADNGCGFDPRTIRRGLGLQSLDLRARALRGAAQVHSVPGLGTTVELAVPLLAHRSSPAAEAAFKESTV